jgi:hypothetical protein
LHPIKSGSVWVFRKNTPGASSVTVVFVGLDESVLISLKNNPPMTPRIAQQENTQRFIVHPSEIHGSFLLGWGYILSIVKDTIKLTAQLL